ncbi:Spon1 [Symbiodinium sp. CCMP2456]|nr:Spon1 [Symbiodinium sp. CCMP2456]
MARAFALCAVAFTRLSESADPLEVTATEEASFQCMNPLFRIQWHTGATDLAQLLPRPSVHHDLLRCPFWNQKASCCSTSLEPFQLRIFDAHRDRIDKQVQVLEEYLALMLKLRSSDIFEDAVQLEQDFLDRAIDAMRSALSHAKPCILHLLAFVAGMVCFSCQPDWVDYVWRNPLGQVTGVNVDPNACIYVDRGCGTFGHTMQVAYLHVMESRLAKYPAASLPDFSMFFSREALCEWLRGTVAVHPLAFQPSDVLTRRLSREVPAANGGMPRRHLDTPLTAAPLGTSSSTSLPQAVVQATAIPTSLPLPQAPTGPSSPALAFDPAKDGLASDFRMQFAPG